MGNKQIFVFKIGLSRGIEDDKDNKDSFIDLP